MIEKIKKLLNLANSDNQHEAELASKKAHKLMMKHNLSMAKIQTETPPEYITDRKPYGSRIAPEDIYINQILKNHFFVDVLVDKGKLENIFIGTRENVEVAQYVFNFLKLKFKALYKIENEAMEWRGKNRKMFFEGLFLGLNQKLEEQKKGHESALLVIDANLKKYVYSKHNPGQRTGGAKRGSREALKSGIEKGKKISIAKRLNTKTENSNKFLT